MLQDNNPAAACMHAPYSDVYERERRVLYRMEILEMNKGKLSSRITS